MLLEAGVQIAADGRLLEAQNLQIRKLPHGGSGIGE
jgi:magnesium-transporting ATPase (P-type)